MKAIYIAVILMSLLTSGCIISIGNSSRKPKCPNECKHDHPNDSAYASRIQAAQSILSFTEQDKALASIAQDAAHDDNLHYTLKALSQITAFTTKDQAAEKCIEPFLQRSQPSEAKQIADQITAFTTKDRVLTRIAQTPTHHQIDTNN